MKLFTQLTLVSAIAASGSAFAMQSMDDAALSETTGQDGITIVIAPPQLTAAQTAVGGAAAGVTQLNGIIIGAAILHDKDGIRSTTNPTGTAGGAIIIGDADQANTLNATGVQIGVFGSTPITVNIDASGNGAAVAATNGGRPVDGTAPVLNISVGLPTDLLIRTGDIWVAGSNRSTIAVGASGATVGNAATGGATGGAKKILNSMDIALGGATMNIQLGNTPQGAMIKAGGTITGGLHISGLSLTDASATINGNAGFNGDLGVGVLTIKDTVGANLTLAADINVTNDVTGALTGTAGATPRGGLFVTVGGAASNIMMQNITLGSANSTLGDLELINVQSAGTHIAIMGH